MLRRIWSYVRSLLVAKPVRLAIVRRYADANGNYVGELYMDGGNGSYGMVGASLDSFELNADGLTLHAGEILDTRNDFLAFMPAHTVRVGALDPADNDRVRAMVAKLPRKGTTLVIQNGFIEQPQSARI